MFKETNKLSLCKVNSDVKECLEQQRFYFLLKCQMHQRHVVGHVLAVHFRLKSQVSEMHSYHVWFAVQVHVVSM